ncbi:hypothetical protein PT285_02345 [Lactobacillus sp. ESL0791]|uniref:hypothetical protein n=1 Tax=Lactobacillus sp. ESL0791 TaxID=2983234 RepID=UPI0023F83FCE|nr:hypothetical protein [Lactobacillus sp. ESL0791]MDF7638274.1 hypothetical protein [Lactobacillus sp. ESL0791]
MQKRSLFPIIYGFISALIAFIAVIFVCWRTFHFKLPMAMIVAGVSAVFFFVLSWFRGHASVEIKRITRKYRLTDEQLARLTGLKATDFPIYHDQLQLIIPKRHWAHVLAALQKYEQEREQAGL